VFARFNAHHAAALRRRVDLRLQVKHRALRRQHAHDKRKKNLAHIYFSSFLLYIW